jgi:carbon monoxide dehydrogenase subunit G
MAKVKDSIDVKQSPDDAWAHVLDLSRYGEWLTLHDGWRSELPEPDEIGKGTQVSSVIGAKNAKLRFDWVVDAFDPPRRVDLKGDGKGGVKVTLTLKVEPAKTGSKVGLEIDLSGSPMMSLIIRSTAKVLKGEINQSLKNFQDLYS